jgi:hypothetical protein
MTSERFQVNHTHNLNVMKITANNVFSKIRFILYLSVSILPTSVVGHQDTPVALREGDLHGLPTEFEPAKFNPENMTLNIAGKNLVLPDVLPMIFPEKERLLLQKEEVHAGYSSRYELSFSASWYHGPSILPPYMVIGINPKGEDFKFDIHVDLENASVMKAYIIIETKNMGLIWIPIATSNDSSKNIPGDWRSIIGIWGAHDLIIEISEEQIKTIEGGEVVDYPSGNIKPVQPGEMKLILPSGKTEHFTYAIKGDVLELSFQRASGIGLARLGSDSDKAWRKRMESIE